jgi:hypothetical protein
MLPDARVVTLPGRDHLTPFTHPDDLATVIAGFIDSTSRLAR